MNGALAFCIAAVTALTHSNTFAGNVQDAEVRATLEAHRRALTVDTDGLHGAGGAWLLEQARGARFTLIGESHHNVETPPLTAALLKELRPAGYATYVVDSGAEVYRALGEGRSYDGNATRVALIKRNFLAHLRRAGESALSDRRALIKMGAVLQDVALRYDAVVLFPRFHPSTAIVPEPGG